MLNYMKLHITKEQWDEILEKTEIPIKWDMCDFKDWNNKEWKEYAPNIGSMICFLFDDIFSMTKIYDEKDNSGYLSWVVTAMKKSFKGECLCDALWEAVKYKLKKNEK